MALGLDQHASLGLRDLRRVHFLTWGEIFSLFPSTCTDTFWPKFATANLCFLYTAKGASAFLVPLANIVMAAFGNWHLVFVLTAIMNFVVVALALGVLKPLHTRYMGAPGRAQFAGAD